MAIDTVHPDLVRFEMRMVQGQDPNVREQKRPGAFGRFLSGIGKVLGAVAMPLSLIFPPAGLAAAGMYGLGALGDGLNAKAQAKMQEKAQRESMTNVSFPGLGMGSVQPAMDDSGSHVDTMKLLGARTGALNGLARRI